MAFQRNALDPAPLLITSNPSPAMAREPMRFAFTAMGFAAADELADIGELPAGFRLTSRGLLSLG